MLQNKPFNFWEIKLVLLSFRPTNKHSLGALENEWGYVKCHDPFTQFRWAPVWSASLGLCSSAALTWRWWWRDHCSLHSWWHFLRNRRWRSRNKLPCSFTLVLIEGQAVYFVDTLLCISSHVYNLHFFIVENIKFSRNKWIAITSVWQSIC